MSNGWKTLEGQVVDDIYDEVVKEHHKSKMSNGLLFAYIATDSQNIGQRGTSFVQCLVLHKFNDCAIGNGARVYYIKHMEQRYKNRQRRLLREAELSINLTQKLEPLLTEFGIEFEVHADVNSYAGDHGQNKSHDVHDSVKGWIESFGWKCKTKPHAWAAAIVADRHTKGRKARKQRPFIKRKVKR